MRPTDRSANWVKTAGETSMLPEAHSGHLSATVAVAVLPWSSRRSCLSGNSDRVGYAF